MWWRKKKFIFIRKNQKKKPIVNIEPIDKLNIEGDFIESQAFAYLAVRSFLKNLFRFQKQLVAVNH